VAIDLNPFPADQARIIRDIQRMAEEALTAAKRVAAVPITRAAGPFVLPNSAQPAIPRDACALYAVSGELRVIFSDGTVKEIPDPVTFTQAAFVASISGTPGDAPSTYSQAYAQSLRNQMDEIRDYCHATRDTEIAAGLRESA
jgi:hypothetical protein